MNDRIGTGMAEATRLTRAGQLIEATAVIQRMFRGMVAPDATSRTADEPVDVPFNVFDEAPLSPEAARQRPDPQTRSGAVITLPPPDVAVSPHECGSASTERTDSGADLRVDQHSGAPSALRRTPGRERAGSTPSVPEWATRLHATLRSPHGGLGGLSMPMPEQARSDIWAGGQFLDGSYISQAGTRTYKLYIPNGYRGQALPLVVMLHGCTQTPEDFAAGTRMNVLAERELFLVVYPAQAITAN